MPDAPEADLPQVSVIIPMFNQAAYVGRTIDSILTQTFTALELLAVDDGSTDETAAIAEARARHDPRMRVIRRERNGGIAAALNTGLAAVRAQFVARIDGDDIATPDRLEKQVAFLNAHPEVGMVGGAMTLMDVGERKLVTERYITDPGRLAEAVLTGSVIPGPTPMFRGHLLQSLGGWRSTFDLCEDYDLTLRVAEKASLANLPDVVNYYRMHAAQATAVHGRRQAALAEAARISARYRRSGRADPMPDDIRLDAETLAEFDLDLTDMKQLQALLADSAKERPSR
jgi:glycosyltransferase involved in cell wall biosynthesis